MGLPAALCAARRADAARTLSNLPSAVPTSRGAQPTSAAMRWHAAVLSFASGAARSSAVSALATGVVSALPPLAKPPQSSGSRTG